MVGTCGIAVSVDIQKKFCLQRNTALIKPCTVIDNNFLLYALQSSIVQEQAKKVATGTTQKLISLSNLSRLRIPIAPINEQKLIVEKTEALISKLSDPQATQSEYSEELTQLDQSILAKAFRGQLVPQDPTDEPASLLLDRIRTEREAAAAAAKAAKTTKRKTRKKA